MERKEQLSSALRKIFWAYIFLYFNINLGTIDILPSWVAFIMFSSAIDNGIAKEEASAELLKPITMLLGIYYFITWILAMFGITSGLFLISEAATVIALYFHFQLLTNLANIARKYGCEQEKGLLNLRTVQTILMTILAFTVHFEEIYWLSLTLVVIQVIIMICICYVLSKFRHAIEELSDDVFHERNIDI